MSKSPRAKIAVARALAQLRRPRPVPPSDAAERADATLLAARAVTADRLLQRPVFVMSSIRSGSTLLRVMLNTHSAIYAPHELHLRNVKVTLPGKHVTTAMAELGLDERQLEYLLWDRLLHHELMRHGKRVLVNKTPDDAFMWRRVVECWPDVRFIILLRHPAAVTDSWSRAHKDWTRDQVAEDLLRYMRAVEQIRTKHGGLELRYEDMTTNPEREMRRVCEFIGVDWEPAMLEYGQADHGAFLGGLGDWSGRIKSGKVQPPRQMPTPDEIPDALINISKRWGYLPSSFESQPKVPE